MRLIVAFLTSGLILTGCFPSSDVVYGRGRGGFYGTSSGGAGSALTKTAPEQSESRNIECRNKAGHIAIRWKNCLVGEERI